MIRLRKLVSGGQTGADRAALDVAVARGLPYGGWCPLGGWAEDLPEPPGLLRKYPNLVETPSRDPSRRTARNVRDSDATLVLTLGASRLSPGTYYTTQVAARLGKPLLVVDVSRPESVATVGQWLASLSSPLVLNVAGPRESQSPGLYAKARAFLDRMFEAGIVSKT